MMQTAGGRCSVMCAPTSAGCRTNARPRGGRL